MDDEKRVILLLVLLTVICVIGYWDSVLHAIPDPEPGPDLYGHEIAALRRDISAWEHSCRLSR